MKILDKLFRRQKGSIDIVTITPTDTVPKNDRATYYADMLLEANLKPLTKTRHFQKMLSEIPTDKLQCSLTYSYLKLQVSRIL